MLASSAISIIAYCSSKYIMAYWFPITYTVLIWPSHFLCLTMQSVVACVTVNIAIKSNKASYSMYTLRKNVYRVMYVAFYM